MSTTAHALAIPKRPKAEIATGFHLGVRSQLAAVENIEEVDEGRRRLLAWQQYVTKREQRSEIAAATRWCEVRIGELLGEAEPKAGPGRGKKASLVSDAFIESREDRRKFRLLAKHKELVAELIADGRVSRGAILAAIRELERNGKSLAKTKSLAGSLERLRIAVARVYAGWPAELRNVMAAKLRAYADELDETGELVT